MRPTSLSRLRLAGANLLSILLSILLGVLALLAGAAVPAPRIDWQPAAPVALGGGTKGAWRQNDSRYDYVDDATAAWLDGGLLGVAWADQGRKDVLFRTFPGAQPVNVSRNGATFSWHPRIASGQGQVYLLWQEIVFSGGSHGGDILFARSADGGRSFGRPLNLSASRGGDGKGRLDRATWSNGSLDLAVGGDGTVVAAWTEFDGALWLARSPDAGASFSRPLRIAGDENFPARAPSLAAGAGKRLALAWSVGESDAAAIRVAVSDDGGLSFGAPRLAGTPGAFADAPRLAFDTGGALHLVHAEQPERRRGPGRVMYTRLAPGATAFASPRAISPPGAGFPALAMDAQGRLVAVWEVFPRPDARPRGLAFSVSADGGGSFGAPQAVPGSAPAQGGNGSYQGLLGKKLALAPDGGVAVVNSNLVPGKGSRVWLMRGRLR